MRQPALRSHSLKGNGERPCPIFLLPKTLCNREKCDLRFQKKISFTYTEGEMCTYLRIFNPITENSTDE